MYCTLFTVCYRQHVLYCIVPYVRSVTDSMYCTVVYRMYGLLQTACTVLYCAVCTVCYRQHVMYCTVLYRMYGLLHTACNVLYSTVPYVRSVTHRM